MVVLVLLLALSAFAGPPAHAGATHGVIDTPCGSLAAARYGPQGFCGWRIPASQLTPGAPFTLSPGKPADLDIYFDSPGATDYVAGCGTGALTGVVPVLATQAIVVLAPGTVTMTCPQQVSIAYNSNVPFVFNQ